MPIPDLIAAGFTATEDSKNFKDTPINGAMKYEKDGWILTKKRTRRDPGRMIEMQFSFLSDADKRLLEAFYEEVGRYKPFAYYHPTINRFIQVVFESDYVPSYVGAGTEYRWDITGIKLRSIGEFYDGA